MRQTKKRDYHQPSIRVVALEDELMDVITSSNPIKGTVANGFGEGDADGEDEE